MSKLLSIKFFLFIMISVLAVSMGCAPMGAASIAVNQTTTATSFTNGGNSFGAAATLGLADAYDLKFLTSGLNRMAITSAGNVGIGTTSPNFALVINLSSTANDGLTINHYSVNTGSPGIRTFGARGGVASPSGVQAGDFLGSLNAGGYYAGKPNPYFVSGDSRAGIGFYAAENWTNTSNGTYLSLITTAIGATSQVERLRVDAAGNVGIGTASAANILDILATNASDGLHATNSSVLSASSGGAVLMATALTPTGADQRTGVLGFGAISSGTIYKYGAAITSWSSEPWSNTNIGSYLKFETAATAAAIRSEKMRIDPFGNVGIGTTSPLWKLTVAGGITNTLLTTTDYAGGTAGSALAMGTNADTGVNTGAFVQSITNGGTSGGNLTLQGGGGNVGIGSTSPVATLEVNGFAKLKVNSSAPVACTVSYNGSIAVTSQSTMCICKGGSTAWVKSSDGTTACVW